MFLGILIITKFKLLRDKIGGKHFLQAGMLASSCCFASLAVVVERIETLSSATTIYVYVINLQAGQCYA